MIPKTPKLQPRVTSFKEYKAKNELCNKYFEKGITQGRLQTLEAVEKIIDKWQDKEDLGLRKQLGEELLQQIKSLHTHLKSETRHIPSTSCLMDKDDADGVMDEESKASFTQSGQETITSGKEVLNETSIQSRKGCGKKFQLELETMTYLPCGDKRVGLCPSCRSKK